MKNHTLLVLKRDGINISILAVLFAVVSVYMHFRLGIKVVPDSPRYLNYADNLQDGFYFDPHNFWYFSYVAFIYLIRTVADSVAAIVIAQYILSFLAVIALYKAYSSLFKDLTGAFISGVLYILFIEIISWNAYVLCESLFCSFTCFSILVLARVYEKKNIRSGISAVLVVLFTAFIKPTGVCIVGALGCVFIYKFYKRHHTFKVIGILALFMTVGLVLLNQMLATFSVANHYTTGEIIYGITGLPHTPGYDWMVIDAPSTFYLSDSKSPLIQLLSFILHHPAYWVKLFIGKALFFLLHLRPFWSLSHNSYVACFLLSCYAFFFYALAKASLAKPVKYFAITYILGHTVIIAFTSVDWDGRFLIPVLPVLFVIAAKGFRSFTS